MFWRAFAAGMYAALTCAMAINRALDACEGRVRRVTRKLRNAPPPK